MEENNECAKESILLRINNDLEKIVDNLYEITDNQRNCLNRALGTEPTSDKVAHEGPESATLIDELENTFNSLRDVTNNLSHETERLERLM